MQGQYVMSCKGREVWDKRKCLRSEGKGNISCISPETRTYFLPCFVSSDYLTGCKRERFLA